MQKADTLRVQTKKRHSMQTQEGKRQNRPSPMTWDKMHPSSPKSLVVSNRTKLREKEGGKGLIWMNRSVVQNRNPPQLDWPQPCYWDRPLESGQHHQKSTLSHNPTFSKTGARGGLIAKISFLNSDCQLELLVTNSCGWGWDVGLQRRNQPRPTFPGERLRAYSAHTSDWISTY